ncbi:MAG: histidine kinase, partial [Cyclobacteriaceae bacterium]
MKVFKFRWSSILSLLYLTYIHFEYTMQIEQSYFMRFLVVDMYLLCTIIINHHFLLPLFISKKKMVYFILVVILTIAIGALLNLYINNFYNIGYLIQSKDYFMYFWFHVTYQVAFTAFFLLEQLFIIQKQKRKLESEKIQAELSLLKYQVNPHFLFNTLNNIYSS